MSKYHDRAVELRACDQPHYNCTQSTLIPFVEDAGIAEATAYRMTANFGGGMKCAAICGAITGGLMILGMHGVDQPEIISDFYRRIKSNHQGCINCADLLRINKEQGGERKPHCDKMVYECVALAEEMLKEQGKL